LTGVIHVTGQANWSDGQWSSVVTCSNVTYQLLPTNFVSGVVEGDAGERRSSRYLVEERPFLK